MKPYALLCALFALTANAQLPSDFRTEQVAMALSEYAVKPGDTLEAEGQVCCLAAGRFMPYSNYLYIECVSPRDSALSRQKISCKDGGRFAARVPVDYDWVADVYCLRAYTRLMMNFSADAFCVQPFLVGKTFPARGDGAEGLQCRMTAVGGRLIEDCMQRVAVCLHDDSGFPVSRTMNITTVAGNVVSTLKTSESGLAMANFIPQSGESYFLSTEGGAYRFAFPKAQKDGMQIQCDLRNSHIRYQINGEGRLDSLRL